MMGRPPKTTQQQMNEGDPRKHGAHKLEQRLAAEPKAVRGLPPCPKHVKGLAREAWKFWAEELESMGLDRRPDGMMLEGACFGYARAIRSEETLARDGDTFEQSIIDKKSGERIILGIKKHPAVPIAEAAWRQVKSFCSEFGLSPVSRTRLSIERKDSAEGDLMAILSRPREPRGEHLQ